MPRNTNYQNTLRHKYLLTQRQFQIVELASMGMRAKEISLVLGVSPKTVDNTKQDAFKKIFATCHYDAVVYILLWRVSKINPEPRPLFLQRMHGCKCKQNHATHCMKHQVLDGLPGEWTDVCQCKCHK